VSGDREKAGRSRDHHDEELAVRPVYDRRLLARLLAFARPHHPALGLTVVLLVAGMLLKLAGPKVVQLVIDGPVAQAVQGAGQPGWDVSAPLAEVTRLSLWFLAAAAATSVLALLREWLMNRTGQRIVFELRNRTFEHLLRLPVGWYDRHAVGWTVTRATSDVDALSELFTTGVATLAYDVLMIAVILVVLVVISPSLSLAALLLLPLMIWVSFRFRLQARTAYRATRASLARMNAFLQERLAGLSVVRLFRREAASARRFGQLNGQYWADNMLTVRHFALFFPTVDTVSQVVRVGCLVWGAWLIADGRLTVGVFVQFWMYLDFVFEPIRELAERYNVLQAAMAAAERIFGILDTPAEDAPRARPAAPAAAAAGEAPAVSFEHVSFAYPSGPPVLQDVSFAIRRGERVAVVGHTGAGKTTLVSLLCRFHETPHGVVRLHGQDVCSIPHRELRRRVAVVQQDVFLFSDSVAANIRMGHDGLPDERVRQVAQAVHADAFVRRLPQGYGTRLLERGANLSSGQRQLLAFARALASDPDVLVLDEATSSVDSETEALVEDATRTLLAGRTALVIAHRLSTVVSADRIVVLHKGRVHEEGRHDELLARRGLYWKLYRLHLAGGEPE
jgi:ABC-type multidrug transport system fused ATPase/permease subunit